MALCLSGCAIPPPVTVAKLILDGISYASTEKSVNDHVLSEVAQEDCAVWRVVKGEVVCRDYAKGEQSLLATVAEALQDDPSDGATAVAQANKPPVVDARIRVQTAGQLSAADPIASRDESPDL